MSLGLAQDLIDDVMPLVHADYDRALAAYVEGISGSGGIEFIGQFGTVGTPGVSDLDVLVVVPDDRLSQKLEASDALVATIPNGRYLFWHPPAVLPSSLVEDALILHTFAGLRPLGPGPNLTEKDPRAARVRAVVWNTFVWGTAFRLGRYDSIRRLLLILGNIAQSIDATNELFLGRPRETPASDWTRDLREQVLGAAGPMKRILLTEAFEKAFGELGRAEWALQSSCVKDARPGNPVEELELMVGDTTVVFSESKQGDEPARPTGTTDRTGAHHLPSTYLRVVAALESAFGSRFISTRPDTSSGVSALVEDLESEIGQELKIYEAAVSNVRSKSQKLLGDERSLIGAPFVVPFALKPGRDIG